MSEAPDFVAPNGPDNAIPRFYLDPVRNNAKSEAEGRPIFEEREMVEISIPGDRKTVSVQYVKEEHKLRWPRHYAAFKQGAEVPLEGTPIREWAAINRAQAEELAFAGVLTVEILAGLDDAAITRASPMGGMSLRAKAQRFIEQGKGAAPANKLAAELADKDAIITNLKDTIAQLEAKISEQSKELAATRPGGTT